jgi:hypothetical protein
MTEPLADTWQTRDLPVLRIAVAALDERPGWAAEVDEIDHGMDQEEFMRAVQRLEHGGYLTAEWSITFGSTELISITSATKAAFEATGAWPTSDVAADRLLAALKDLADGGRTEDVRSRARKALDALSGAGRDIAVGVATAALGGQLS